MPLFIGNVWKVCAQPTVMRWRDTVRSLEPAPEMALVGKTERRRHVHRLLAQRQQLTRFGQPQLDQPRVRCQVELALKAAREGKTVGARLPR